MTSYKLTLEGRQRLEGELHQHQQQLAGIEEAIRQMLLCKCDLEQLTLREARERQANLRREIDDLESTLSRATTLPQDRSGTSAELGAFVTLSVEGSSEEVLVQIVAAPEATVTTGEVARISDASPLGSRILGRDVGDTVTLAGGKGERVTYTVKAIRW